VFEHAPSKEEALDVQTHLNYEHQEQDSKPAVRSCGRLHFSKPSIGFSSANYPVTSEFNVSSREIFDTSKKYYTKCRHTELNSRKLSHRASAVTK
jgi:hypothetical protein